MLRRLKIDPEFQSKIPPLTFEELNLLETNILEEGRILNPLIVWNGLIVDGHNRFAILKNHPEIKYTVLEKEFANRYPLCDPEKPPRDQVHRAGKGVRQSL